MTKAYAIAYLRDVDVNEQIVEYIERIDATLAPYGGHFLVHGGELTPAEGTWDGDVIIIEFPDQEAVHDWYGSAAYQAILPLRTQNSNGIAALVMGVPDGYRAVDKLNSL
ncbi:DUF1330 domain-containing protein [Nocardioides dubius]|uniref:DUF1330 domain-containing protein n=1 Tax=Nocardioides dubius TaxID=317019 RepID=A0ABP4ELC7_9ACTN